MTTAITTRDARRLALARAGLLKPELTSLPSSARGRGPTARAATLAIIRRFGYLQLDTVSIAGARSHALVLLSRLRGLAPELGEELLGPGQPLFEYWGHEACWLPIELYPTFQFRREAFRHHPWWGDVLGQHRELADDIMRRIERDGPLRSLDLEGAGSRGWWNLKTERRVAQALWSSGELAIRERRGFQRTFDLTERVIPARWRHEKASLSEAMRQLVVTALGGHGWARTQTIAQTWRLSRRRNDVEAALLALVDDGTIVSCDLIDDEGKKVRGWIRIEELEQLDRLRQLRPRRDVGVLLSPFDPVLWDRARVKQLFDFDQLLEIFKPAAQRKYGYYCLPVLAGERLVARVDLKADRKNGTLNVLSQHFEGDDARRPAHAADGEATRVALSRYSAALGLRLAAGRGSGR